MKVTEFFESSEGDIYSISLSSENGGLIADDIRRDMEEEGIVIARSEHLSYISVINNGIQRDFGKPE